MIKNCLLGLLVCLFLTGSALSQTQDDELRRFREHLAEFDGYSKEGQQTAIAELKTQVADGASPTEAMDNVLAVLNKNFATGLTSYQDGDVEAAIPHLQSLVESKDPFLCSESKYFLARCFLENEDHENAYPLLTEVDNFVSPRRGECLFLRGICEAKLLQREKAIESLAEFMRSYPNASERQRVTAWRQLELLALVEEGSLVDVHQKMEYSRRRLAKAKANKPTQQQQSAAIAILDKLIKEAEEREALSESESEEETKGKKSQAKAKPKGGGKEGPGGGADDQTPMKTVRQIQQETVRTPWDHLRDKKRDAKALAAIKEKYPARYRALIEQYYRSLQEETDR